MFNETTLLFGIVILLLGVIIGGAGGQAIIRKALKFPETLSPGEGLNSSEVASIAATAASEAVVGAMESLRKDLGGIEKTITTNNGIMTSMLAVCKERHKALDHTQELTENRLSKLEAAL